MRARRFAALVLMAGVVAIVGVLAEAVASPNGPAALAQSSHLTAQNAPTPSSPGSPGAPGYSPGQSPGPGIQPGFRPGFRPYFRARRAGRGRGRGFGRGLGIVAGFFALYALLRFLVLVALLVIAWKVITWHSLWGWGRPDAALQAVRERFGRGEITEEEYRRRLAALS
jgi:uncharacterized membrane protein